jgi:hypothetical protein
MEIRMTKLGLLGAAAVVLTSALAGPAMAQQVITNPGRCAQFYPDSNCQNYGAGNPYTDGYQRLAYRHSAYRNPDADWNNGWDRRDSGFWPGDVAAGVVGGALATAGAAVDTAGAIATAPFRNDSYAYYDGGPAYAYGPAYNESYNDSYGARNGFVCQPGTWFRGEDGRRHLCQ